MEEYMNKYKKRNAKICLKETKKQNIPKKNKYITEVDKK